MRTSKYEVLAPAGNLKIAKAVIAAGADAVYVGGAKFGARAYADNMDEQEMLEAIDHAHLHGRKLFLTVNTMLKNQEMEQELYAYLKPYYERGLDAVIVQDFGVMQFVLRNFPEMDIHASTQMTIAGVESATFLKEQGAARVVTSRELSFDEIRAIHEKVDVEIESFVHGALCYCYSGQCLLSSMLGGRSGNRGRCAQPCRLPYTVLDGKGKIVGKEENYILSPKDLCTIEEIPSLLESGIYSLKIEGRMKQAEYAAGVVSLYRKYVDLYEAEGRAGFKVSKEDRQKLLDFGNRSGFTKGYYVKHNGPDMMAMDSPSHARGNEGLQKQIKELYVDQNLQEKINGTLRIFKELPAILEISLGEYHVRVDGKVVQKAQKQPMTEEKLMQRMKKTGSTPFVFEHLEIQMEEDAFLPIQALNELRRQALDQLQQKILSRFERKDGTQSKRAENSHGQRKQTILRVSVENLRGLEQILACDPVEEIYLDSNIWKREELMSGLSKTVDRIHNAGKKAALMLPQVFRKETSAFYQGVIGQLKEISLDHYLVRSLDEYEFLVQHQVRGEQMILDHTVYAFSNETAEDLMGLGVAEISAPLELNRKELKHYRCDLAEQVIYGYQTLMVSAQCVHKNTQGCDKKPCELWLKDRYGKRFLAKNYCNDCYNLIYNCTPLCLFGQSVELAELGFSSYRIQFTRENGTQIEQILSLYEESFLKKRTIDLNNYLEDYTNGHFKRGVE